MAATGTRRVSGTRFISIQVDSIATRPGSDGSVCPLLGESPVGAAVPAAFAGIWLGLGFAVETGTLSPGNQPLNGFHVRYGLNGPVLSCPLLSFIIGRRGGLVLSRFGSQTGSANRDAKQCVTRRTRAYKRSSMVLAGGLEQ